MQDSQNYFSEIVTAFLGAGVTWVGRWLFDRHKEEQEAQKSEVELVDQVIKIYKNASQDLEDRVNNLRLEMDNLMNEMSTLKSENRGLKSENTSLKKEVAKLTARIKELETNHG